MSENKPNESTQENFAPAADEELCENCGVFLGRGGNYLGMCLKCRKEERLNGRAWQGNTNKEKRNGKQNSKSEN